MVFVYIWNTASGFRLDRGGVLELFRFFVFGTFASDSIRKFQQRNTDFQVCSAAVQSLRIIAKEINVLCHLLKVASRIPFEIRQISERIAHLIGQCELNILTVLTQKHFSLLDIGQLGVLATLC